MFLQREWEVESEKVLSFINHTLLEGSFPLELSQAHITLIPKKDAPESMADFRPITLLNTSYKILTKAIVQRLRPLLQRLIGPFQRSFLPGGRGTGDNIVLTQEIVHTLMKKKGRLG